MGLFSTKRKHYVDTSVVRVVDDAQLPDGLQNALIDSIFSSRSISESVIDRALNGPGRNFKKMYNYAKSGDYFYGLPDAKVLSSSDGFPVAQAQIETEVGYPITLDYLHYRPLNNFHAGWKHLAEVLAYDHATNEIVSLTASLALGTEIYLDKMVAVVETLTGQEVEQSSMGHFGPSAAEGATPERPIWADPNALRNLVINETTRVGVGETESIELHYVWLDSSGAVQKDFLVVNLSAYDQDQEYYQARYTFNPGTGAEIGYWIYDPLTGTNTTLNDTFQTPNFINPGTYFPFAVFRSEDQNRATTALENTDQYKTTVKLLDYIGLDFREIADAMHDDADIGDIDQAVMMMGVPITATNVVEIEYLFNYFTDLHDRLPADAQAYNRTDTTMDSRFGSSAAPDTSYAVQITDADFDMTISFDKITRNLKAGVLGPIGTVTNSTSEITPTSLVFNDGIPAGVELQDARILRKQVSLDIYEEITVASPKVRYRIYKNKGAEGGASDDRLLIPLDYNVVSQMAALKEEELYYRSLHFVFNSHITQKLKWYQSGLFKAVLVVIAVVLTIMSNGKTWKAIGAALAVGAVGTAAMILIKFLVLYIIEAAVFQFVLSEVAKEIGVEATFWLAVAAIAVGGYKGLKAGKLVVGSDAVKLLSLGTGLANAVSDVLQDLLIDLQAEAKAFSLYAEELSEDLERAEELLANVLDVNPFNFISQEPNILFGEPPDAYFGRLVHAGNIGTESMNIVHNYVDIALKLPTLAETN